MSVRDLVTFIQSSVKLKYPDKQVAEYLKHVTLKDRLDSSTIEQLQSEGAGPKTVAALKDLRDASAKLVAPAPVSAVATATPAPIPAPDSIEQGQILQQVREYALNYIKELPNYICVEVVRRYVGQTADNLRQMDRLNIKLTFFDQHEDYELEAVNDTPAINKSLEKQGGTISQGDFGSLMLDIFRAESQTRFDWDHWATLRGKRAYVFSYDIAQSNSRYHVEARDRGLDYVPAYRGLIYVDKETKKILRIVMTPYGLPASYPIQDIKIVLDYEYLPIGDVKYLLPYEAVVTSREDRYYTKNDEVFKLYRKFGTETTIHFDTPDADEQGSEKK